MHDLLVPNSSIQRRAERAQKAGRRSAASWVGHPSVAAMVHGVRPSFQKVVATFELPPDQVTEAALHIMGGRRINVADGTVDKNPFALWAGDRLEVAKVAAGAVRSTVADLTAELRALGVPIQSVVDEPAYADRNGFTADHFYFCWLLWSDIPLHGRSGAEIAADLPALPTVAWDEASRALHTSDHTSQRDMSDVFAVSEAWRQAHGGVRIKRAYPAHRNSPQETKDLRKSLTDLVHRDPSLTPSRLLEAVRGNDGPALKELRQNLGWDEDYFPSPRQLQRNWPKSRQ
jgi:hypothetical protein